MNWHRKSGISISSLLDLLKDLTGVEKVILWLLNVFRIDLHNCDALALINCDESAPRWSIIIYNLRIHWAEFMFTTRCQEEVWNRLGFFTMLFVDWIFLLKLLECCFFFALSLMFYFCVHSLIHSFISCGGNDTFLLRSFHSKLSMQKGSIKKTPATTQI